MTEYTYQDFLNDPDNELHFRTQPLFRKYHAATNEDEKKSLLDEVRKIQKDFFYEKYGDKSPEEILIEVSKEKIIDSLVHDKKRLQRNIQALKEHIEFLREKIKTYNP